MKQKATDMCIYIYISLKQVLFNIKYQFITNWVKKKKLRKIFEFKRNQMLMNCTQHDDNLTSKQRFPWH